MKEGGKFFKNLFALKNHASYSLIRPIGTIRLTSPIKIIAEEAKRL